MDKNKEVSELQSEDLENVNGGMRIPFEKHFDPSILQGDEMFSELVVDESIPMSKPH